MSLDQQLDQADHYQAQGEYEEAIKLYDRLLRFDDLTIDQQRRALYGRARCYYYMGQWAYGLDDLQRAEGLAQIDLNDIRDPEVREIYEAFLGFAVSEPNEYEQFLQEAENLLGSLWDDLNQNLPQHIWDNFSGADPALDIVWSIKIKAEIARIMAYPEVISFYEDELYDDDQDPEADDSDYDDSDYDDDYDDEDAHQ